MSEELIFVFGIILAAGVVGYLLLGKGEMKLTAADIASYASNAGFSGDDLVIAVAVALAESSGDTHAEGDNGTSYGLWQIHYTVHPELLQGLSPSVLFDPQMNANAAYELFKQQGWEPWSTFKNADMGIRPNYLQYLSEAAQAVSA